MRKLGAAMGALLFAAGVALSGCGGGGEKAEETTARVVERILRLGQDPSAEVRAYVNELPEDLPEGLPTYPGSDLVASFVIELRDEDSIFVIYDSADSPDDILRFFEEALEEDPWQVEGATSSEELVALQFAKVDDANVTGGVAVNSSEGGASILLSLGRVLEEERAQDAEPFLLGESRNIPPSFPAEVPIYPEATVTQTAWLRSPRTTDFAVTLLTEGSQDEVIAFYREEFTGLGWDVVDEGGTGFALAISFSNGDGDLSGNVSADAFSDDDRYTQVDIQVTVSPGPGD